MYYFSYLYLPFFLGLTTIAYFITPIKKRWGVLLAASLIFYLYYAKFLTVFILFTSLTIYFCAIWIDNIDTSAAFAREFIPREKRAAYKNKIMWQKKAVVAVLVLLDFGVLALLKYSGFASGCINAFLQLLHVQEHIYPLPLMLPLGISFYTLQAVSYVVDVYRGKVKANRNFAQVLLFVCFFPQIVEGPIGRYDHLAPQLYEGHRFDWNDFTHGMQLILWGLFKEIVIADRANMLVTNVMGHYTKYSGAAVGLATLLYTLQLYADFSGCIDVAAGSAQMLGIHLAPNFQRPFFSRSVNEFWRRWHITLGAWLRDYVFYPVSLSKPLVHFGRFVRQKNNKHLGRCITAGSALFFVWVGMGIWHGAGWKYLVYGMYYYLLMMLGMLFEPVIEKACRTIHLNRDAFPYRLFQILRTFVLVNIGMLLFRADNLHAAVSMFLSLFRGTGASLLKLGLDQRDFAILAVSAIILLVVGLLQEKGISLRRAIGEWPLPARWAVYLAGIFFVIIFGGYGSGYAPAALIYAGF